MIYLNISHSSDWWLTDNIPSRDELVPMAYTSKIVEINNMIIRIKDFNDRTRIIFKSEEDKVEFILKYL